MQLECVSVTVRTARGGQGIPARGSIRFLCFEVVFPVLQTRSRRCDIPFKQAHSREAASAHAKGA